MMQCITMMGVDVEMMSKMEVRRVMMTTTRMKGRMRMRMRMQIDARQCGDCSFKSVFPNFTATRTLCVNRTVLTLLVIPALNLASLC